MPFDVIKRFCRDETAATSIEYGLIASLVALVLIAAVRRVGSNMANKLAVIAGNLS